jgi:GNAT superfamily N-acetyltransferase
MVDDTITPSEIHGQAAPGPVLTIRRATPEDAPAIARHRRLMFEAMGCADVAGLDVMETAFIPWVRDKLHGGEYLGWLAVDRDGLAVAGAGLWVRECPPNPRDMSGRRGYVFNVYTYPVYRRQGWARRLVEQAVDWCRAEGIGSVTLHYSEEGRSLYETMGFTRHNEMIIHTGAVRPETG